MTSPNSRRTFLKSAGALAGTAALGSSCAPVDQPSSKGLNRPVLDALAEVVLPQELASGERQAAVSAFVTFVNDYDPVAEEMHGYGYSDIRYLPADPAPAWNAQLAALDLLAQRSRQKSFAALDAAARRDVVEMALSSERGPRLPAALGARHVAVALLAHWSNTPGAWNMALGVTVSPDSCRPLLQAVNKPIAIQQRSRA